MLDGWYFLIVLRDMLVVLAYLGLAMQLGYAYAWTGGLLHIVTTNEIIIKDAEECRVCGMKSKTFKLRRDHLA